MFAILIGRETQRNLLRVTFSFLSVVHMEQYFATFSYWSTVCSTSSPSPKSVFQRLVLSLLQKSLF